MASDAKEIEMSSSVPNSINDSPSNPVNTSPRSSSLYSEQSERPVLGNPSERSEQDSAPRQVDSKDGEGWLPLFGSRRGNWANSMFHNVTAIVGAGVLGLPSAMAFLGWVPGTLALVLSWMITLYTLWQMVEMHEMIPDRRLDQYHELGQEGFGKKLGLWIVLPPQLTVQVGLDIVYMVTGGQCLQRFYQLVRGCDVNYKIDCTKSHGCGIGPSSWIVIFAAPQFILAQLPNLSSISGLSLAAAVMSFSYSTIAWGVSLGHHDKHSIYSRPRYLTTQCGTSEILSDAPSPTPNGFLQLSNVLLAFGVMRALGIIAFAFGGHNVVLEIQATLKSTLDKPSKIPMWKGVKFAYVVVGLCYIPVALVGYWAFGANVSENVLFSVTHPRPLIAAANLMVVIHTFGSYQLYAITVIQLLETTLTLKFNLPRSTLVRLVVRCSYVFLTGLVACTLPFFGDLLGFFGGFAFAPTTYFLPCMIWLRIFKPKRLSIIWIVNWVCIVLGILLAISSSIGGLFYVVAHAQSYGSPKF